MGVASSSRGLGSPPGHQHPCPPRDEAVLGLPRLGTAQVCLAGTRSRSSLGALPCVPAEQMRQLYCTKRRHPQPRHTQNQPREHQGVQIACSLSPLFSPCSSLVRSVGSLLSPPSTAVCPLTLPFLTFPCERSLAVLARSMPGMHDMLPATTRALCGAFCQPRQLCIWNSSPGQFLSKPLLAKPGLLSPNFATDWDLIPGNFYFFLHIASAPASSK